MTQRQKYLQFFADRGDAYMFSMEFGPVLEHIVVLGGVHGNEPSGVEAMVDCIEQIEKGIFPLKHCKITWVIGNPRAFAADTRFIEANLNRVFHSPSPATYEQSRVTEIRTYLDRLHQEYPITHIIDMHSDTTGKDVVVIGYKWNSLIETLLANSPIKRMFTIQENLLPGSSLYLSKLFAAVGIGIENGSHFDPNTRINALHHLKILFAALNCTDSYPLESVTHDQDLHEYQCIDTIRMSSNFSWNIEEIYTGRIIPSGTVYALSDDRCYVATCESVLFAPELSPKEDDHDAGFICRLIHHQKRSSFE